MRSTSSGHPLLRARALRAPEGQVQAGFVSRVDNLALSDELATAVYGADSPDFAALGYHRRDGESGWWIASTSYARQAGPFTITTRNARGFESHAEYDSNRQFPTALTDALGHRTSALVDRRAGHPR